MTHRKKIDTAALVLLPLYVGQGILQYAQVQVCMRTDVAWPACIGQTG